MLLTEQVGSPEVSGDGVSLYEYLVRINVDHDILKRLCNFVIKFKKKLDLDNIEKY